MTKAHVFSYIVSHINSEGDWDSENYYLIFHDSVTILRAVSDHDEQVMQSVFPDRVEYEAWISNHKGHLEPNDGTDELKEKNPEIYEMINKWCPFVDNRSKVF